MNSDKKNENAFKHSINGKLLIRMSKSLKKVYSKFAAEDFLRIEDELELLELKPRVQLVRTKLKTLLPASYTKALEIILLSVQEGSLTSFDYWPYTDFIQTYGLAHFEESMRGLYILTQVFTAEFAVRPFIIANPEKAYKWLGSHVSDKNMDVRRWISEGTRPRLPWGEKIHFAVQDPSYGLALLKKLSTDVELYVRKSVANHLNDIAKDHPDIVIETLNEWKKDLDKVTNNKNLNWIIRHSLRTLIKKGHQDALALIGVTKGAKIKINKLELNKYKFAISESVTLQFEIESTSKTSQKLVIDYIVHHVRANKSLSAKVFKLKVIELGPFEKRIISKKHSLKVVTTRKYYSGEHLLEIQINGVVCSKVNWYLNAGSV